ncbi:MAG: AraC family transcriptional regulator [Myxococcota bacterium]
MDPLSDVISFLQLRSYRVGGFEAGGQWSVGFDGYEAIKCYAVTAGACWIAVEGAGEPKFLQQGDCVLLPHGRPFQIASDLALPADDWRRHFLGVEEGAVVKLNAGVGVTLLGSHFQLAGWQAELLLGVLPPLIHLHEQTDRERLWWAFDRLRQELTDLQPGGILIAQQLACMTFVQALRLYLDEGKSVGWLFALSDKHVGAAIAAMHRQPARRWTVAGLADEVGMSRSAFAARFAALVGEGSIEYLTRWRMLLAGRSLSRGESVGTIAHSLGYESESAFRTAFKRVTGQTPRQHARLGTASEHETDPYGP